MKTRKGRRLEFALVAVPLVAALAWILFSVAGGSGAAPEGSTTPTAGETSQGEVGADSPRIDEAAHRSIAARTDVAADDLLLVRGRVLDPDGTPLGGALVGDVAADRPAATRSDGRFELLVERGHPSVTLLVIAGGQAPLLSTQEPDPAARSHEAGDLQLVPAGTIRGRITDSAGKGLPGAIATLRARSWNSWLPFDVAELHEPASTDAEGYYSFADSMPGRYRIEASAPGMAPKQSGTVRVREGEEALVDPIVLESGLRITGTAVDARTGLPVERFAADVRRIGVVDPESDGTMVQQLQRQVDSLRATATGATDPELREQRLAIASQLESRLERVRREGVSRPVSIPADPGPVAEHPGGRFGFDGLQEGLYAVAIASPDHRFVEIEPIELRRGAPPPDLRVELAPGHNVLGVVVSMHDGSPIAGATVELVRTLEASREVRERRSSLYPWVFARSGPQGVIVETTRTSGDGSFEFRTASPGRCYLSVRHAETADHDTDPFHLQASRRGIRIAVGARASLTGRVGNVPVGQEGEVDVLVLGGHGTLRTVTANGDGTYRFDGLQPGSYLVRAFPAGDTRHVSRLFGSIFPLYAGAVDAERIPPRDVTLGPGESGVLDVMLDLPPTGTVGGTVAVNGQPAGGGRAILRPQPQAPGSSGLSLRADYDELGRFMIPEVPAGKYRLSLYGATRQELYNEPITVEPDAIAAVQVDLAAGGLRGRVTAPDTATPEELRGNLWVLPGAVEAPDDPYEYRRENRTHRVRVRNGVFEDDGLTPGPAVLILDIPGRHRVVREVVLPAADVLVLDLTAAGRLQ